MELTPEQWQKVKALLESALEKPPVERSSFLGEAAPDSLIRQEVERLLANPADSGGFLSNPAVPSGAFSDASPDSQTFSQGEVVAGRFRITRFLARGGMGEVYEAEDAELAERVALKSIRGELLHDSKALDRFKREVHLARKVTHPNVCRIFDLFRHTPASRRGSLVLVAMELLEGETLADLLDRQPRLTVEQARPIALQIAAGLGAAHAAGILHRDLKPGNVLLVPGRKGVRAVITDFGLALRTSQDFSLAASVTGSGQVLGTPAYMSPEQVEGKDLTPASDVYALGLVLYQMLTGTRAFEDPSPLVMAARRTREDPIAPCRLAPELDRQWESVILKCLARDPTQRFQNGDEVADALRGETNAHVKRRLDWRMGAKALTAVALLMAAGAYFRLHRRTPLTDKDTIVVSDFDNRTGDAVFDDTLKTALAISLRQSPLLNVLSDNKVAATLRHMTRSITTPLAPDVAREVCQRVGSKAYIAGSIATLGNQYVLGLKTVNCQSGELLAEEQVTAVSKEKVLDALGRAASRMRGQLGESLATVQKFDIPLDEATTSSLEALKAYSVGLKAGREKGSIAALPYDQRAIELDPNFAMAYVAMGHDFASLGESERASDYATKAFQLREHSSEWESLAIAALYYKDVTGELDKAAQTYQEQIASYPQKYGPYVNVGIVYASLGQYEKANELFRQSLRLGPSNLEPYGNLVNDLLALQRFDEARQIVQEAQKRKLDDVIAHLGLYALGFLQRDPASMEDQQKWFQGKAEENIGIALASDTEAYTGHLARSRALTRSSVDSAIRADSKENAAVWLENAALREAAFGNRDEASQLALEGMKLYHESRGVQAEASLALAMAGNSARAETLAQDLNKRFPSDTQMQSLWLPAIRVQLAIGRNNPAQVAHHIQTASGVELGQIQFATNISCLYPTYIRGEAYLAAEQGTQAAAEFQKILDHSGMVWNCWTGALARLGLGRAYVLQSKTPRETDADNARGRALEAYRGFLTLWKDADPEIPILHQAKAEYAKLQK